MDNIDVMIAESDSEGQTRFVNLALCETLECDPEDWYGEGWKNFIVPEQIDAEVERWEAISAEEKPNPFHPITLVSKRSHKRILVKARAFPIKASGELVGYVGEMYKVD
jgi:PAS domain S-box-containing protein